MDKNRIAQQLQLAQAALLALTQGYCTNSLATNCRFVVCTASPKAHKGMNLAELNQLVRLNNHTDRLLTEQQIVDLLWVDGKVPLYINMEVKQSSPTLTTFLLLCSRRLGTDEQLNNHIDPYAPFHILVPLPPDYQEGVKFDINFRGKYLAS